MKLNKLMAVLLMVAIMCTLTACGNSSSDKKSTVDMKNLCTNMLAADDGLTNMISVYNTDEQAERNFAYLSDMDYTKVEGYFLSYSANGETTDEIAVIAVKDVNDIGLAKDSIDKHLKSRRSMYEQYQPENVKDIDNAVVFTKDQYVVLIISKKSDAVKVAFEENIK